MANSRTAIGRTGLGGFVLAAMLWLSPSTAQAAWYKAETDRFVVYGEAREQKVRDYATKLMTFDRVLRTFHPSTRDKVPSTKLVVYLVDQRNDLRRVRPGLPADIGGFYLAMNEGVFAVALSDGVPGAGDDVMFHEYAHHFMLENFPAAYPAWFVEGFAEYFMTAEITKQQVAIGGFNPSRAYGIFAQTWLPMESVLSRTTAETRKERLNAFYSQSWLLMHYMRSDPVRARQLDAATQAIAKGQPSVKAFQDATGLTMPQLTEALKGYRKLQRLGLKNPYPTPPPMTVTLMPKSADDFLLDDLRLILSPTGRVDGDFLASVRRRAAKYPGDALTETTLARAEFVMGDVAAGRAIMQRRMAASPGDKEALILAGSGELMAGMRDKNQRETLFRAARPLLAKAYAVDKADFRPLFAYALSRSIEAAFPTDNDLEALLEARALAPAVQESSLRAGLALLRKGDRTRAAAVLAPVINNPHAGRSAAQARALLDGAKVSEGDIEAEGDEAAPPEPSQPPAK